MASMKMPEHKRRWLKKMMDVKNPHPSTQKLIDATVAQYLK